MSEEKVELLLWTGQLLLQSGANSNRIDRNIQRCARFLGFAPGDIQLHLNLRTIQLSIKTPDGYITRFRKVLHMGVNQWVISAVSRAIWRALKENITPEELYSDLQRISTTSPQYPKWLVVIGIGLACAGFCRIMGGEWVDVGMAALGAATGQIVRQQFQKRHFNHYFTVMVCATLSSLVAGMNVLYPNSMHPLLAVIASVLYLIPGIPFMNATDDLIDGFTMMGIGRATIALLIVLSIAFGLIFTLNIIGISKL